MTDKLYDWQISYWQQGCDDAKAGRPFDEAKRWENGYHNGYYYGLNGKGRVDYSYPLDDGPYYGLEPDPPLKNPYMESIEAIEGVLERLQTFAKEFPESIDKGATEEYIGNLLEVRDSLHAFRQKEMEGQ